MSTDPQNPSRQIIPTFISDLLPRHAKWPIPYSSTALRLDVRTPKYGPVRTAGLRLVSIPRCGGAEVDVVDVLLLEPAVCRCFPAAASLAVVARMPMPAQHRALTTYFLIDAHWRSITMPYFLPVHIEAGPSLET